VAGLSSKTNQEIRELIVKASDRFSAPIINMYGIPDFALAVRNQLAVESNNDDDFVVYPNPASDISFALPAKFTNGIVVFTLF
jgi:hypothetical protein